MDYGLWIMDYGLWIMEKIIFNTHEVGQPQGIAPT
jgi:hypothetical protein